MLAYQLVGRTYYVKIIVRFNRREGYRWKETSMIECKTEEEIVFFDGRVIDRFRARGASLHFHIDFVESVEITSGRKGRQYLSINLKVLPSGDARTMPNPQLSPETIPQAQAFVDEVMRAIASR